MDDLCSELSRWEAQEPPEQERIARVVADRYPQFRFAGLRRHGQGKVTRLIAVFDHADAQFILIPAGETTLGYDRTRPWTPSKAEQANLEMDWMQWPAKTRPSFQDFVGWLLVPLTPLRRVRIEPFLIETESQAINIRILSVTDSEVDPSLLARLMPGVGGASKGNVQYRIDGDGTPRVWEEKPITHAEAVSRLAEEGFRLPTSDEWEYACGAGSRTLFWWGDHSPDEMYEPPEGGGLEPIEWSSPEVFIEQIMERTMEVRDVLPMWDDPSEDLNTFGLTMWDPQGRTEFCAEENVLSGGDGGVTACGGMGIFASFWLPKATAYAYHLQHAMANRGHRKVNVRRAFALR